MDENYVYKKEVDWSLFNYGFAIPYEYQVIFTQGLNRFLKRGESKDVYPYLNGESYKAKLDNNRVDEKFERQSDIVQIRYHANSDLAKKLKSIFQRSFSYIYQRKCMQKPGSKKHIVLPDEYKESSTECN